MIRRFETRDLDEIMDLWLHANIESHSFIEADYWKKNYDMNWKKQWQKLSGWPAQICQHELDHLEGILI